MHIVDILIFAAYMIIMLGIGFFFLKKNKSTDDYFVGGRSMGSLHVGLSVVATDVGGGFSVGLGGLGFTMGLSGSWMLFTGLIGAWLSAALLIPKVSKLSKKINLFTFPQIFKHYYGPWVALLAGVISAIGYLGFTSSQLLAGAKLASATFPTLDLQAALLIMGVIAVVYTVMGGIKAVIYTDTVQWIILMSGLIFIGIPIAYNAIGGWEAIKATIPAEFLSFKNITWYQILNWCITIIPIWFVGMTLYQRIYACKGKKEAQRAWFIAGLFEWPIMAIMGVMLGMFARVALLQGMFEVHGFDKIADLDAEMGLPLLLKMVLPVGLMGLMMSAYFSAILSTADSCLMAASGNVVTDIIEKFVKLEQKQLLRLSQIATLVLGAIALIIALSITSVLDLMLKSYAFMVSGLLIPIIGAFFWKRSSPTAAGVSMLVGGTTTTILILAEYKLFGKLDANIVGITAALVVFVALSYIFPKKEKVYEVEQETSK